MRANIVIDGDKFIELEIYGVIEWEEMDGWTLKFFEVQNLIFRDENREIVHVLADLKNKPEWMSEETRLLILDECEEILFEQSERDDRYEHEIENL